MEKKCPECCGELEVVGYMGSGHITYLCTECGERWEIKKREIESGY